MRHPRSHLAALLVVAAIALLASACGGGGAPGVAQVSTSTTIAGSHASSSGASELVLAGRCLRANGLTNFPDPSIATVGPAKGHPVLDKGAMRNFPAATMEHAMTACAGVLTRAGLSGGSDAHTPQQVADGLAFAQCVRRHGILNFPDPNGQGQFDLAGTGIKEHALTPKQLAAAQACLGASHGEVHLPAQNGAPNS